MRKQTIVSVDIQPAYKDSIKFDMFQYCKYITRVSRTNKTIVFYNSFIDKEDEDSLFEWLFSYGLSPNVLGRIDFVGKDYGFVRNLCDNYHDLETVSVLRYMIENNIDDSRKIKDKSLKKEYDIYDNPVWIPDVVIDTLRDIDNILFLGGGKNECLKEIELIALALNKKFKFHDKFVY